MPPLFFFSRFSSPVAGGDGGSSQNGSFLASSVSAGGFHACALIPDGTVNCRGLNSSDALGNASFINSSTPFTVTGITTGSGVASCFNHTCSNLSDSTVRCWGDNSLGQLGSGTGISVMTPVEVTK